MPYRKTLTFGFILDRDASKQIRPGTGSGAPAQNILIKLILNGKCGAINSGPILSLQRLFESDLNNGPSPSHSNLVSIYIYSDLLLTVSCICPRAAGLTSIMALSVTRIVALFLGPRRLFESGSNNGLSPGHPSVVLDARTPRPDFNSDLSKQIRHCTGSVALHERNIPVV